MEEKKIITHMPASRPAGEARITKIIKNHQGFTWKVGNHENQRVGIIKIHQGFSWKTENLVFYLKREF